MAHRVDITTTFEPSKIIQPFYTGGDVSLGRDGRTLATCLGEDVVLNDLGTGEQLARIEGVGSLRSC
jgi:U3 small nucleolar RNA-associated protein 13